MTRFALFALPLIAAASPAVAEINPQARVGNALRAGCSVQHVHTPAGKMVHNAPIVRCPAEVAARAAGTPAHSVQSASSQSLSVSVANVSAR